MTTNVNTINNNNNYNNNIENNINIFIADVNDKIDENEINVKIMPLTECHHHFNKYENQYPLVMKRDKIMYFDCCEIL